MRHHLIVEIKYYVNYARDIASTQNVNGIGYSFITMLHNNMYIIKT